MLVQSCNYIINLAALISIPYSYETPHSYLYNNVLGTLNLLTSAKKNKIKHFIQASTSEVYGTAQYVPIDEKHPLNPQSPYAASKVASDQFALSFYKSFNLPVNIIRPFNTFGPRQSLRAVIPTIIYQMIKNKGNINLGSLNPRRDFTYVTDTADGILKMLNLKKFGNVVNLGMGVDYSVKEILEIISKKMKLKYKVKKIKDKIRPKKSEVNILNSNNTKAKKILKWKPKYFGKAGFEKAIEKTIDWYSVEENLNKFNHKSNVK
jgi:nucleoside-diphosphate-sugar epimerase